MDTEMKTKTTYIFEVNDTMIVADTIIKAIEIYRATFPDVTVREVRQRNFKGAYDAVIEDETKRNYE